MKYEPLEKFLRCEAGESRALSFAEIETILGAPLPKSARQRREWWSNNPKGHVNAQAWLRAGFRAEQVKIGDGSVVFRRQGGDPALAEGRSPRSLGLLDRLRATLGGTVTVAPGVDLTAPTWEMPDNLK
jgi:hypothetical protein